MIDVSIIILSYNGKELLGRTLDSVARAKISRIKIETIVADNGSTDGSIELVRDQYGWATLVENGENFGFSKGNNLGVVQSSGKYVLFLNSDTEVSSGVVEYIYDKMEQDASIGIATCRVELSTGEIDPASHRGFPTPWRALTYYVGLEKLAIQNNLPTNLKRLVGGYHLVDKDLGQAHEIDSCTGAFMMMKRETGEIIGWWSEDYFMYGEDLDICFKVKQLGLKVMYYPEYKILHIKHASGLKKGSGNVIKTPEELEKIRQIKRKATTGFYDAMIIFYEKFYKNSYPGFIRAFVYIVIRLKKHLALSKI